jgi:hypothetical protein
VTLDEYRPNRALLLALLVPAAGYLAWQWDAALGTEVDWFEGSVGLVLGLYICSRPAANGIDLFFAERGTWRRIFTARSGFEWIVLNALVMFVGWFVLVTGVTRFSMSGPPFHGVP